MKRKDPRKLKKKKRKRKKMSKASLYSAKGTRVGQITLPKNFSEKENLKLLAQAIRVYEDRKHPGLSKVKTRGEVSLTTRKAYRQKGTGLARHGARSAPIFVGGGIAHGPKGKKRELSLPKKMKKKALDIALSLKAKDGRVVSVKNLSSLKKTKEAQNLVEKILKKEKNGRRITFVLKDKNGGQTLALRNLEGIKIISFEKLDAYSAYFSSLLIFDEEIFAKRKKTGKKEVSKK